jgi:hypothetical protein
MCRALYGIVTVPGLSLLPACLGPNRENCWLKRFNARTPAIEPWKGAEYYGFREVPMAKPLHAWTS